MPWQSNSGGPWGGGGGGPWGGGGGGRGGGGGQRPPDIDDILRQGRDKLRVIVGGGGGRGQGPGLPPIGRKGWALGAIVLLGLWVWASIYTVKPEERAVELLFGEYFATTGPGLQFAPYPIVTYEKRAVTRENVIDIGYDNSNNTRMVNIDNGLMLTGDENIVDIDFQVVWNISDLRNYLFNIAAPQETIRAVSESAMRDVIGQSRLGPILNRDRAEISRQVREQVQATLDSYESGVSILRVNFDRADPPPEVIDAFRDVQAAAQDRNTLENQAEAYANRALAEARGEAARVVQSAEAYAARVVNEAAGEAARFEAILTEYARAPDVTRKRLYLETMEQVFGDMNKVLLDETGAAGQGVVPYLPLNELNRRAQPQ